MLGEILGSCAMHKIAFIVQDSKLTLQDSCRPAAQKKVTCARVYIVLHVRNTFPVPDFRYPNRSWFKASLEQLCLLKKLCCLPGFFQVGKLWWSMMPTRECTCVSSPLPFST